MIKQSTHSFYESPIAKSVFVAGCAFLYFLAFQLNALLFNSFTFSHGVNWVFIPSGLRLLFVLVLLNLGSVGIAIASCAINYMSATQELHLFNIVTALISGFAPLAAREICVDYLKVGDSLNNLTPKSLFQLSIVFALVSSVMHQVWFFWNGVTIDFITSSLVMAIGDWFGSVLVLAIASLLIKIHRRLKV